MELAREARRFGLRRKRNVRERSQRLEFRLDCAAGVHASVTRAAPMRPLLIVIRVLFEPKIYAFFARYGLVDACAS